MEYTVKSGDTLSEIATRLLGPSGSWQDMIRFNPWIQNENLIYPGQVLFIPDASLHSDIPSQEVTQEQTSASQTFDKTTLIYLLAGALILAALLLPKPK